MWWSMDQKFGRLIRPAARKNPNILTITIDHLQRIWDSVAMRLTLAFIIPYVYGFLWSLEPISCRVVFGRLLHCLALDISNFHLYLVP